jgi:hypothetical protein
MAYDYENTWLPQDHAKPQTENFDPYHFQHMHPCWQSTIQHVSSSIHTAPSSPDRLPVHNVDFESLRLDTTDHGPKDKSQELVGMGLYDSPLEVQSSSLLFGGARAGWRKTLKLEESFEPEDVDDEEDDQEASDAGDGEEYDATVDDPQHEDVTDYDVQSIANHLCSEVYPDGTSIASQYLATLNQLNTGYYAPPQNIHRWI